LFGIATGADLHGLEAEGFDLVEHGLERKMIVDRVEYADGNLAVGA